MNDQKKEEKEEQELAATVPASQSKEQESVGNDVAGECPQCAEYKAGWQRAVADYQNLLKDNARARIEWAQMSEAEILADFIPVYDNLKKAFNKEHGTLSMEQNGWVRGIEYIRKQFGEALKKYGVEEIETVGARFDPQLHEVVGEELGEGKEDGVIVKEIEGGYKKNGRVIRVAKVVVRMTSKSS